MVDRGHQAQARREKEYTHVSFFGGIGGVAVGLHDSRRTIAGLTGVFRTIASFDVDEEACEDYKTFTGGAVQTPLDLFDREQYTAWHGRPPPAGWREATVDDIIAAMGGRIPDLVTFTPPCVGFSQLLSSLQAGSPKYLAMNGLLVRAVFLFMEACKRIGGPMPMACFVENVPGILARGPEHIEFVANLFRGYKFAVQGRTHCCGKLGGLAQKRGRWLLVARNRKRVPPFIYNPPNQPLRPVGDVIQQLPLPDSPEAGKIGALPRLQWQTILRLACIPPGGDFRRLEDWKDGGITVVRLEENVYAVVPVGEMPPELLSPLDWACREGTYGVLRWDQPSPTITGRMDPSSGYMAVADLRLTCEPSGRTLRVIRQDEPSPTITATSSVWSNASTQIADAISVDRLGFLARPRNGAFGVLRWDRPSSCITAHQDIHTGANAVADSRFKVEPSGEAVLHMVDLRSTPPVGTTVISPWGSWNRVLTVLDRLALQGFRWRGADGKIIRMAGRSRRRWGKRVGNAVPPPAATAVGNAILDAFLAADAGVWRLSHTSDEVWVRGRIDGESPSDSWIEVSAGRTAPTEYSLLSA